MEKSLSKIEDVQSLSDWITSALDTMQGVPLAEDVRDYVEGKFGEESFIAGDLMVPKMDAAELDAYRTRVITVEKAAEILAAFESDLVERLSRDPREVFMRSCRRFALTVTFILGNVGIMIIVLFEMGKILKDVTQTVGTGIGRLISMWWNGQTNFLSPFDADDQDDEFKDLFRDAIDRLWVDAIIPVWDGLEYIVAESFMQLLQRFDGEDAIHTLLAPVHSSFETHVAKVRDGALPQRRRVCLRRRRRAR